MAYICVWRQWRKRYNRELLDIYNEPNIVKAPPDRREIFAATAKSSLRILSWTGLVAVPTLTRKNRADVCETAAIYSLSLLARFLSLSPRIVQVSRSNFQSWRQLAIRMSFVGRLRRVGRDRFHSCFVFSHILICLHGFSREWFSHSVYGKINWVKIYQIVYDIARRLQKREDEG